MNTRIRVPKALAAAGKKTCWHRSPDGTRVLLLPYGGRALGLYPPQSDDNFFWVNRALCATTSARAVFAQEGWQNTGGDRTWLSPEIEVFFPDYPQCLRHVEPAALDAAEYAVALEEDGVAMTRTMTLGFARAKRSVKLRLSKWIGPAANPLRYERGTAKLLTDIEYAGYTQRTRVKLLGDAARSPLPVGIWNLLQLPHGGEMIIPTYKSTQPRVLFGEIPQEALVSEAHCLRFRMNLRGEHKIAVRAAASTGALAMSGSRGASGRWSCETSSSIRRASTSTCRKTSRRISVTGFMRSMCSAA